MVLETELSPMLLKTREEIFDHPDYIYEIKWDGFRCLAHKGEDYTALVSRNGWLMDENFPEIMAALKQCARPVVLDGELVVLWGDRGDFSLLQGRSRLRSPEKIQAAARKYPATLLVFDILRLDGRDVTRQPLMTRKKYLADLLAAGSAMINLPWVEGEGRALFEAARRAGHEGVVAKRKTSIYRPGARTGDWLKIKHWREETTIITGYKLQPEFGLLVTRPGKAVSTVRQGIGPEERTAFLTVAQDLITDQKAGVAEIQPFLKCRVQFKEWTNDGRLRHPVFLRFVTD